jgi:hypothetical protein
VTAPQPAPATSADKALAVALVGEARTALARLAEAWPWLADMAVPGPQAPTPAAYVTDTQRRIEADQIRKDREAAFIAVQNGKIPTPHPDAARPGPVAARGTVVDLVRRLTEKLWADHRGGENLAWPVTDPTTRPIMIGCWYCASEGHTMIVDEHRLPGEPDFVDGPCPLCRGQCQLANLTPCWVCRRVGPCRCDLADAVMSIAGDILGHELGLVADPEVASSALAVLEKANDISRRAARVDAAEIHLRAACPACDRRELVADVSALDPSHWLIRCRSDMCRCDGAGCPCGRLVRYRGRPHRWPAEEWGGEQGLAARLGVDLRALRRKQARS